MSLSSDIQRGDMGSHMLNLNINSSINLTEWLEMYNYDKSLQDDVVWILSSSFIIFTMQSGFGLLESGSVSARNEVNIMTKNIVDVVCGGLLYWAFGYGITFGESDWENPFCGWGSFFFDPDEMAWPEKGWGYAKFLFQLSFATTAATIVSGSMAERTHLKSYIVFSTIMVLIHSFPAHWVWARTGFLRQWGAIDIAGASAVHLVGGAAGLTATIYLKPRLGRFGMNGRHEMSSPTNALLGTFMLWWGWLGFNCGSTWGVTKGRWNLAARAAVATILSSIGGGVTALVISFVVGDRKCKIDYLIDGILGSLVSITAICALARTWQSIIIGSVGAALALGTVPLLERLQIDDPVGVVPVHMVSAIWGLIAVGFFTEPSKIENSNDPNFAGIFYGGNLNLLALQLLTVVVCVGWSVLITLLSLLVLSHSPLGLRMSVEDEKKGADLIEHGLAGHNIAGYEMPNHYSRALGNVTKAIEIWRSRVEETRKVSHADSGIQENGNTTQEEAKKSSASSVRRLSIRELVEARNLSSTPDIHRGLDPEIGGIVSSLSVEQQSVRHPSLNSVYSIKQSESNGMVPVEEVDGHSRCWSRISETGKLTPRSAFK